MEYIMTKRITNVWVLKFLYFRWTEGSLKMNCQKLIINGHFPLSLTSPIIAIYRKRENNLANSIPVFTRTIEVNGDYTWAAAATRWGLHNCNNLFVKVLTTLQAREVIGNIWLNLLLVNQIAPHHGLLLRKWEWQCTTPLSESLFVNVAKKTGNIIRGD